MKFFNLITALSLVLVALSAHAERAGNGSDPVLALQELARQNSGLSTTEVLQKAFDESEGRVPELKASECQTSGFQDISIAGLNKMSAFMSFPSDNPANNTEWFFAEALIYGSRRCVDGGPLLGTRFGTAELALQFNDGRSSGLSPHTFHFLGDSAPSAMGLVLEDLRLRQDIFSKVELRQYNKKIVIFRMTPAYGASSGGKLCRISTVPKDESSHPATWALAPTKNGTCAIGYFWINE